MLSDPRAQAVLAFRQAVAFAGAKPPTRQELQIEVGATGTSFFRGLIKNDEFNKELTGQRGAKNYNLMRKTDAQVGAILRVLKLPLLSATWFIECDDEKVEAFLREALFERLHWHTILRHMLLALDFGYEVLEKVYAVDAGKIWLRKLAHRQQDTIWQWDVDESDDLRGIVQQVRKGEHYRTIPIPIEKLVLVVFDQEGNNFEGVSVLRHVYKHWFIKDGIYKIDAIAHERFGVGVPVVTAPEGYTPEARDAAIEMCKKYRAGEQAHMFLPPGWEFRIEGSGNASRYNPLPSIKHHDEMISRAVLAQFLNLGTTETGSRSLGDSFQDLYMFSLRSVADQICDVANGQIIRPLLDFNFAGSRTVHAALRYTDMDTKPPAAIMTALNTGVSAGIITPDDELEDWARDLLDAPARPEAGVSTAATERRLRRLGSQGGSQDGRQPRRLQEPRIRSSEMPFWRERREHEMSVAFREIEGRQEDAADQIADLFGRMKQRWTDSLVGQVREALADDDPSDVADVSVPEQLQTELLNGVTGVQRDLHRFGRRTVMEERARQFVRARVAEDVAMREEDLDPEEIAGLFDVRARRFLGRFTTRIESVAIDRALSIWRTAGQDVREQALLELWAELAALADSTVVKESRLVVSEAFNLGRQAQAEAVKDQIDRAIGSSLLDFDTCDPCRRFDGAEYQVGTPEYLEAAPPVKSCEGGPKCRCIYVYVFNTEQPATR